MVDDPLAALANDIKWVVNQTIRYRQIHLSASYFC
jgi:hypothetical protein